MLVCDLSCSYLFCRVEIQELKLEESAQTIAELTERLKQYEADLERKESVGHFSYDS